MRRLMHCITDRRLLRLTRNGFTAGIQEDQRTRSGEGIPQGAVISPILAKIYLHMCPIFGSIPCDKSCVSR